MQELLSQDIYFLLKRFRLLQNSIINAVSNNTNYIAGPDRIRIDAYLKAVKDLKAWIVSQPFMDLPQTSPNGYGDRLGNAVLIPEMENLDAMVILELMVTADIELRKSQSSRQSTGMISDDSARWDKNILKIEKFLTDFVDQNSPVDRPDSTYPNDVVGL